MHFAANNFNVRHGAVGFSRVRRPHLFLIDTRAAAAIAISPRLRLVCPAILA
jgi:hypothetical protein